MPSIQEYIIEIKNALDRGEYQRALAKCDKIIKENCATAQLYHQRGICYLCLRQYQLAITNFTSGIKLGFSTYHIHNNLGVAYEKNGDREKAIESYQRAIEINPTEGIAYLNLGNVLFKDHQEDALSCYEKAYQNNVVDKDMFLCLIANYGKTKKLSALNKIGNKALSSFPKDWEIYHCYGKALFLCNQLTLAKQYLDLSLNSKEMVQERESLNLLILIAMVLNPEEAAKYQEKLSNLNSNNNSFATTLTREYTLETNREIEQFKTFIQRKEYEQAKTSYDKIAAKDSEIYHLGGLMYFELGEYQQAIAEFEMSLQLDENNKETYIQLGHCYTILNQVELAQVCYNAAIELGEKPCGIYTALSKVWLALKIYQRAIDAGTQAYEIDSTNGDTCINLGLAYFHNFNPSQSNYYYNKAEKIAESEETLFFDIVNSYSELKLIIRLSNVTTKIYKLYPENYELQYLCAKGLAICGALYQSQSYLEQTCSKLLDQPKTTCTIDIFSLLINIYFQLKQFKKIPFYLTKLKALTTNISKEIIEIENYVSSQIAPVRGATNEALVENQANSPLKILHALIKEKKVFVKELNEHLQSSKQNQTIATYSTTAALYLKIALASKKIMMERENNRKFLPQPDPYEDVDPQFTTPQALFEMALEAATKAIEFNKTAIGSKKVYALRGKIYYHQGNYSAAIEDLRCTDKTDIEAHTLLKSILSQVQQTNASIMNLLYPQSILYKLSVSNTPAATPTNENENNPSKEGWWAHSCQTLRS